MTICHVEMAGLLLLLIALPFYSLLETAHCQREEGYRRLAQQEAQSAARAHPSAESDKHKSVSCMPKVVSLYSKGSMCLLYIHERLSVHAVCML